MARPPPPGPTAFLRARSALGMSQDELAKALGCSQRSVSRWERGDIRPSAACMERLARSVHPSDRGLAREVALAGGTTLEALGLAPPAEAPPPPAPPAARAAPPTGARALDAIVLAAAEAIEASDGPVRGARAALVAAAAKARELGVTLDERLLSP